MINSLTEKYSSLLGVPYKDVAFPLREDCLTTLARYFLEFENITINQDYARYSGWERDGLNFFHDYYAAEGFKLLDIDRGSNWLTELQTGDVLLMSLNGNGQNTRGNANHCAVWIEPRFILHNLYGRSSEIIPFKYKSCTTHILRHSGIASKEKYIESADVLAILPKSKRELLENARGETQ